MSQSRNQKRNQIILQSDNESTFWDTAKTVVRWKLITLNPVEKKEKSFRN